MKGLDGSNESIPKRDVLLPNVQLVDVQTIIWHGLQRPRHGEKEGKVEDAKTENLIGLGMEEEGGIFNEPCIDSTAIHALPPATGGAKRPKNPLKGNPLLNQAFHPPNKKKKMKRRLVGLSEELILPVLEGERGPAKIVDPGAPALLETSLPIFPSEGEPGDNQGAKTEDIMGILNTVQVQSTSEILSHPSGHLATDGSEYTDHLLSQISVVLPNMSSSQVSSVLSALEPNTAPVVPQEEGDKAKKAEAEAEAVPFVKMENARLQPAVRKAPEMSAAQGKKKHTKLNASPNSKCKVIAECKAGDVSWFKCRGCSYLALDRSSVEAHCTLQGRSRQKLRCIGCPNVFHSPQSLKVHLSIDHDVLPVDVHDLLATCLIANKVWKTEAKKDSEKTIGSSLGIVENAPSLGDLVPRVPNEDRIGDNPLVLPTPGFSLFESVDKYIGGPSEEKSTWKEVQNPGVDETMKKEKIKTVKTVKKFNQKNVSDIKIEKEPGQRCAIDGCSARFVYSSNMEYHKQCHSESKWKCPECDFCSPTWSKLSVHLWKQHAIDMELYSCEQCSYKTNSLPRLLNDHRRIHGEERPFSCDSCGKGFKNTKQLRNHKTMHKAKEKPVGRDSECSLCGRTFSDQRMLKQHTDLVHRKLRPFLCSICGHAAGSKGSLRIHARMHTGEKPYSCPDCDYVTGDHNCLRRHKMQHTGAKHYNCPFCPYACIQATTYKSHLKKKHPGMDEGLIFSCNYCNFRTVKKENFLAHTTSHSLPGEAPDVKVLERIPVKENTILNENSNPVILATQDGTFTLQPQGRVVSS